MSTTENDDSKVTEVDVEIIPTLALAAEAVYPNDFGETGELEGYTLLKQFLDEGTGFHAAVWKNDIPESEEYIVAFTGTEASFKDAYTNLTLGLNQWNGNNKDELFDYLGQGTRESLDLFGNENATIHFTGHSLGGALAQYANIEDTHPHRVNKSRHCFHCSPKSFQNLTLSPGYQGFFVFTCAKLLILVGFSTSRQTNTSP